MVGENYVARFKKICNEQNWDLNHISRLTGRTKETIRTTVSIEDRFPNWLKLLVDEYDNIKNN